MRPARLPVPLVLAALVAARLADAVTFRLAVEAVGIEAEVNGPAQLVFRAGGADAVAAMKGALIALWVVGLALSASRFPRLLMFGGATATSVGAVGAVANTWALLQVGVLA
jgi:hypothetical protein